MKQVVYIGTELKLNIHIDPIGGMSMSEYDWEVEVYCDPQAPVCIPKSEAIPGEDDNNYIILIDTNKLGTGNVKLKVTAYIPDGDFEDAFRTEVVYVNTDIVITSGI